MKLRIAYHNEKISWDKDWIFLGSSYQNLKNVENKLKGKRIKIDEILHETFKEELTNYLQWSEKQRVKFNDSIYWWMTELAGRNIGQINFFLYICQIFSLKKILNKVKEDEFLVVSDDVLLIQAIISNCSEYKIKKSQSLIVKKIKNLFIHYYKVIKNLFIIILNIIFTYFCLKFAIQKKAKPEGNVYLLHQFVDSNSLQNKENIKSRYFPNLKEYFSKKELNLYSLPWFEVFWFKKIKALNKLRKEKNLIVEDWLNIFDYFKSIRNFFKSSSCFDTQSSYPNLKIKHLIVREKRIYQESIVSNLRFWTYIPAIKKWSENCESLICIDHYENMIYEHALLAAIHNINKETKTCGYHHTLASKEFTAWHSLKSEWDSKFKPDFIISLGPVSRKMLTNQGVPDEKIIDGPALRFDSMLLENKNYNKKNKNNIVIPLSQNLNASFEIVSKIKKLSEELKDSKYNFIIKPHPNFEMSKIISVLSLKKLPSNLTISNEKINNLLENSLFVIHMSSGVGYDSILNGNIVFNLRSELNLMNNYLDIFEDNFKFVDSHSLESIKNILFEFSHNEKKIEKYEKNFKELKLYLLKNMNSTNLQNLSKFELN